MTNYGLTNHQIQKAKDKLLHNKEFMLSNGIQLDDKIVPFADFVANSYVNSDRYIAELQHRAWSVYEYAKEKDLKNIFITLTLPAHWHKKKTFKNKLISNKKFGGRTYITTINKIKFLNCHVTQNIPFIEPILDFSNTIDKYTPRNASKELSKMLKDFFNERSYRGIEKDERCYFRVTEPHKDGTPHLHMSLYVPADKVKSIVSSINRLFPAPLSKIETEVNSPVSYLMKYVLKTLDDLREDGDKITNLTLWYLYHGISRFYTSRTFVSLEVYRKLNGMYSLRDLTKDFHSEDLSVFINTDTNKITKIENEYGIIYTAKPVNWYDKLIDTDHTYLESEFDPMYKEQSPHCINISIDGEEYITYNFSVKKHNYENQKLLEQGKEAVPFQNILQKVTTQPYQMKNYQLNQYFENIDIATVNPAHYVIATNEMIDRGLIDGERLKLSDINEASEVF
ncbi:MAG: hypothetical protein NTW78_09115 [Campylobacterales bacterium]|nr:hypothetical protein [Campylobacterales bacterium]